VKAIAHLGNKHTSETNIPRDYKIMKSSSPGQGFSPTCNRGFGLPWVGIFATSLRNSLFRLGVSVLCGGIRVDFHVRAGGSGGNPAAAQRFADSAAGRHATVSCAASAGIDWNDAGAAVFR
jgi:hypothetical protein